MVTECRSRIVRFVIVGGLNTCITYAIYLGLALSLRPWLAYGLAYALGIGIAFVGNRRWVFQSDRAWSSFVPYAAMQVVLMGLGSFVSWMLTGHLAPWAVGLAAIAVVLPISFAMNSLFFRRGQK